MKYALKHDLKIIDGIKVNNNNNDELISNSLFKKAVRLLVNTLQ